MVYDPALAVRFSAFTVAYNAKIGAVEPHEVDGLRAMAERTLEVDDPVRRAITSFATQYELHAHDPAGLTQIGHELSDEIEKLNVPTPPGTDRADING